MHSNTFTSPFERAKQRAKQLRTQSDDSISHSQALEKAAHELGYKNWNTAAARLPHHRDVELQLGDHIRGTYLKQPFEGRIVSISEQGNGSHHRLSIELDEAVDVVRFSGFSNFRKRVQGLIDQRGDSPSKTSDGEPHLTVLGHVHR